MANQSNPYVAQRFKCQQQRSLRLRALLRQDGLTLATLRKLHHKFVGKCNSRRQLKQPQTKLRWWHFLRMASSGASVREPSVREPRRSAVCCSSSRTSAPSSVPPRTETSVQCGASCDAVRSAEPLQEELRRPGSLVREPPRTKSSSSKSPPSPGLRYGIASCR